MATNVCSENVSMNELATSTEGLKVQAVVNIKATPPYLYTIVASSITIIVLQFAHAIGLLYVDCKLMKDSDLAFSPTIYLEAIPSYFMVFCLPLALVIFTRWKSWLSEDESAKDDIKPGVIIMTFVASVVINIFVYTIQVLVIVIQVFRRHLARLPSGDRCNCYNDDLTYLVSTMPTNSSYKCICYVPSLPDYTRTVRLFTDSLASLTPENIENYTGVTSQKPFTDVRVTMYDSQQEYQEAYERQTFTGFYITIIIVIMCNLIVLAIRLALWITLKGLWTESEKHYLENQIAANNQCRVGEGAGSVRSCVISACRVTRQLHSLRQQYKEKKISAIKLVIDEFQYAFLEGADALGLYLEILQYAYVDPQSPILVISIIFICIDICLFNWDNTLLIIPIYGERITSYIRAGSALFINIPFFAIRLMLLLDEGKRGFAFLLLVLFLMKEITAFLLSLGNIIEMLREDCKKKKNL